MQLHETENLQCTTKMIITDWGIILINSISNKGLLCTIYKEPKQLSRKNSQYDMGNTYKYTFAKRKDMLMAKKYMRTYPSSLKSREIKIKTIKPGGGGARL